MNTAIIIGFIILGICLIGCSFVLSGAITGAAAALKSTDTQMLQQPTMNFLTEFDAADYLGLSLKELDYMRSEGLLDNTFIAVTSLEQTGEQEYQTTEDGVPVTKVRPVASSVTRFLYNTQLLDQRMLELIQEGQHINPSRKHHPLDKPAKAEKSEKAEKPAKKQSKENKEPDTGASVKESLPSFEEEEQAVIAAAEASDEAEDALSYEDERPIKTVKAEPEIRISSDNPQRKPKSGQNGQNRKPGSGKKKSSSGSHPKKPTPMPVEDDSDMKIVSVKSKPAKIVYSEKSAVNNPSSPVYSSSDDDDYVDIPIIKPAQKSISKPRIAVITSDDDDNM